MEKHPLKGMYFLILEEEEEEIIHINLKGQIANHIPHTSLFICKAFRTTNLKTATLCLLPIEIFSTAVFFESEKEMEEFVIKELLK